MNERENFNLLVGQRVKIARERAGMSQTDLAEKLDFAKHQIVSNIETGLRAVSSDEIFALTEIFGEPLDFFTDPYLIVDESVISYRARAGIAEMDVFEAKNKKLVSAAIRFSELAGTPVSPFKQQLPLNLNATAAWSCEVGSRVAENLKLGSVPAEKLEAKIEKELGIMVLKVDAPEGISGSACHMPQIDLIVINRREPDFRQHFDLAHELFHVLTWTALPPKHHDWVDDIKPKAEKLADAFASGLLMPTKNIHARWKARRESDEIHQWIVSNATEFRVSGLALYWRLVGEGLLKGKQKEAIDTSRLSRSSDTSKLPRLFAETFVKSMHSVLEQGKVSARKAASLVDLEVDELDSLFASYGLASPF
jgi:Zn-dependent peptidase ImmA (M78 family)/DNA-binding XRE family transcriptional regulator